MLHLLSVSSHVRRVAVEFALAISSLPGSALMFLESHSHQAQLLIRHGIPYRGLSQGSHLHQNPEQLPRQPPKHPS